MDRTRALRRRGPRDWRASVLGAVVVVGSMAAAPEAAAAPRRTKAAKASGLEQSYAFVAEGDAAFERGDYEDAIAKYSAAYYGLTPEERASYAGSLPVRNAMRAYDRQVAQQLGRTLLDRQLGFVTEYLETVESHPEVANPPGSEIIAELEDKRSKIESMIAELSAVAAPESDTLDDAIDPIVHEPLPPEPERSAESRPEVTVQDANDALIDDPTLGAGTRSYPTGIALATAGGVLAGVGAGVLAGWWTVRRQAPQLADMEPGYEEGTVERVTYLAREEDRARRYLVGGSVVMGVGAAVAATGAILLIKNRRSTAAISPAADLGPTHAGLLIQGRF